jgi:hypothetical protein
MSYAPIGKNTANTKENTYLPEFSYESRAKLAGNTFELSGSQ